MAKPDITSTSLLAWDKYKDKPIDEALEAIYERANGTYILICSWYWTSIKTKRNTSLSVRGITLLLLIAGTICPIIAGIMGPELIRLRFAQCGVAALASAGLLQVADSVFGWSSGWIRYITTVTAMENLTREFELDWAGYILSKTAPLNESDTKYLFDLAKQFEKNIIKMQSEETAEWVTEYNSGTALLGELIKTQRESGKKAIEAARTAVAATQNGAIELTLVHHESNIIPVTIAIDEQPGENFVGTSWSKLNIPPGQKNVRVVTSGGNSQTIQKVVEVLPGSIARLSIELR